MRVSVLNRGGLAVFGGDYDPGCNEARFSTIFDDTVPVTIEFPGAPSSPTVTASGLVASTPAASGNFVTLTLSYVNAGASALVRAIIGGQVRNILLRQQGPVFRDGYDRVADDMTDETGGLLLMTEDGVALETESA